MSWQFLNVKQLLEIGLIVLLVSFCEYYFCPSWRAYWKHREYIMFAKPLLSLRQYTCFHILQHRLLAFHLTIFLFKYDLTPLLVAFALYFSLYLLVFSNIGESYGYGYMKSWQQDARWNDVFMNYSYRNNLEHLLKCFLLYFASCSVY